MRKNLYRAKGADDADKNVWHEGYYMQMNDTTYCFSEDYERAAKEGKDPRHYYIVFDRMTDWGLPNRHFKADVRQETLCQHTGRYDKNKKSIYEWDIVAVTHNGRTGYPKIGTLYVPKSTLSNISWADGKELIVDIKAE